MMKTSLEFLNTIARRMDVDLKEQDVQRVTAAKKKHEERHTLKDKSSIGIFSRQLLDLRCSRRRCKMFP